MKFNRQFYESLKQQFKHNISGFSRFDVECGDYLKQERNYKDELHKLYMSRIGQVISNLPQNDNDRLVLAESLLRIFRDILSNNDNKPQNLVGWRYSDPLFKISDADKIKFLVCVANLVDEQHEVNSRIDTFVNELREILSRNNFKLSQAASRSITSFYLFLHSPDIHIFIKTQEINRFLVAFTGEKLSLGYFDSASYQQVLLAAHKILQWLAEDGWHPQDMVDVQSFIWMGLYNMGAKQFVDIDTGPTKISLPFLNTILYGPPGTGKTYNTSRIAVEICDGYSPKKYEDLTTRYRELLNEQRIQFVSFHQSFSYEDFIEGIQPYTLTSENDDIQQISYEVKAGVFKKIANLAKSALIHASEDTQPLSSLDTLKYFKMSIGGQQDPLVESYCLDNGYIALGWGGDIDFSVLPKHKKWTQSRDAIKTLMKENNGDETIQRFAVQAMWCFKDYMDIGDIVIISKGLHQVRAIGVIEGEYEYREDIFASYQHFRKVRWIHKDLDLPVEQLQTKQFSQQSIYQLDDKSLNFDHLARLLGKQQPSNGKTDNYVLIIDEINRGNIAKVFGELITLLEPSKRLRSTDELTVRLPYSGDVFGVPGNLYVIGTMNTADRSISLLDTALRRRFRFVEMMPDINLIQGEVDGLITLSDGKEIDLRKLVGTLNERILYLLDRELQLGHAYFMNVQSFDDLCEVFSEQIIPLLQEYFHEDWSLIQKVLHNEFVQSKTVFSNDLFTGYIYSAGVPDERTIYTVLESRDYTPDMFINIYRRNESNPQDEE